MWSFYWNGSYITVTNLFDDDGNEVFQPSEATKLVAQLPDGNWLACRCSPDEIKPSLLN